MSRLSKCLFYFVCIFIIIFSTGTNVMASNSNLSLSVMDVEEKNTIIENLSLALTDKTPGLKAIQCFDVNNNGAIALGHEIDGKTKAISIYDSNGNFKYGYIFYSTGSFGIEWNSDCLNIYILRGDLLVTVDKSGTIVDVAYVEDTKENDCYINNYIFATKKTVNGITYCIKNDMGILNYVSTSYSQLVKITSSEEVILYDVNNAQLAKTIVGVFMLVAFIGIAVFVLIKTCKIK